MHAISYIRAEGLACARGGRALFRDLRFTVSQGSLLVVGGANGVGKTSLLRVLAGFIPPSAGSVFIDAHGSQIDDAEERAKHIGWLGHQDAVKSQLSPFELLEFFSRLYSVRCEIDGALVELGLERVSRLACVYLSTGQRRRLALARLKLCGRPLWLLDEPLAALDDEGKRLVERLVAAHCAAGGIAIAASHEPLSPHGERLRLGE